VAAPAPPDPQHGEWEARVAHVLVAVPRRLRPSLAWLARRWVGRLLARTAAGLVRVQIFDRSMTLAAQAFTSIFPVLILLAAVLGRGGSTHLADVADLPATSRYVLDNALSHTGLSAFGVLGSLVVLLSSTGLARALARAYAAVWTVGGQTPAGPRAAWRWLATVLTLAGFAVGTRLLGWLTAELPLPHLSSAFLLLLADCAVAVLVPWLLLGGAVPTRMLAAGGVAFGAVMLALRPAGSVYLPRALQTSADRYGTIGVAFTYIGWLYIVAFGLLLAAVVGHVVAQDEGAFGRLVRGPSGAPAPETIPAG
jgi:membrane protein